MARRVINDALFWVLGFVATGLWPVRERRGKSFRVATSTPARPTGTWLQGPAAAGKLWLQAFARSPLLPIQKKKINFQIQTGFHKWDRRVPTADLSTPIPGKLESSNMLASKRL